MHTKKKIQLKGFLKKNQSRNNTNQGRQQSLPADFLFPPVTRVVNIGIYDLRCGSIPPTPTPTTARSDANAIKLGEPPAARPKTPARRRVTLKHHLNKGKVQREVFFFSAVTIAMDHTYRLPQTSQPKPQNTAPTNKPALAAKLKNGVLNSNSSMTEGRIRLVINYFPKCK